MEQLTQYPIYKLPKKPDGAKPRKSKVVPDQSMTIKEIVKRYVKGIPVDILQREPVYMDQNQEDFEKLGRMDFGEKFNYAEVMANRAAGIKADYLEQDRLKRAAQEAQDRLKAEAAQQATTHKTTA